MRDRSSTTNRHGIPRHGGTANQCCWPGCPYGADRERKIPLCNHHGTHIFRVYDAEREARWAEQDAREAERRAEYRRKHEVIYYAKIGGHIKIGWTSQLDQRMRSYPPNTELLAVHRGTREDERNLHRRFAVHRSHGAEWYPLVPVILDHIKRVITEHGEPPDVTFGAKPVEVRRPKTTQPVHTKAQASFYR